MKKNLLLSIFVMCVLLFSRTVFSADTTPPTINSLTHSPADITDETDMTITVTASDASGLKSITIYVDSQLKRTCTPSPCMYTSKYAGGTHSYYAEATDNFNNKRTSNPTSFKVTASEVIQVKIGWNIISVPYSTFNIAANTCESGRKFYNYDGATKTWNIVKNAKDLQGGKGYWVYSEKECAIKFFGDREVLSNDIRLKTGWNQIGSTASNPDFASIKSGCVIKSILYYDTTLGNWKVLTEAINKPEKYKGYFVKADSCPGS